MANKEKDGVKQPVSDVLVIKQSTTNKISQRFKLSGVKMLNLPLFSAVPSSDLLKNFLQKLEQCSIMSDYSPEAKGQALTERELKTSYLKDLVNYAAQATLRFNSDDANKVNTFTQPVISSAGFAAPPPSPSSSRPNTPSLSSSGTYSTPLLPNSPIPLFPLPNVNRDTLFPEVSWPLIIQMVTSNIFRPLLKEESYAPPMALGEEMIEEAPIDLSWNHLQLVYAFLLLFVSSPELDPKLALGLFPHTFFTQLIDLFDVEDVREREMCKLILHRLYLRFWSRRPFIRTCISAVFLKVIYEHLAFNGCAELLEIMGCIIHGFVLPVKPEHAALLTEILLPLHKHPRMAQFRSSLSNCLIMFIEKDPAFAHVILTKFFRWWPKTNGPKQVIFLMELEEIVDVLPMENLLPLAPLVIRKFVQCVASEQYQIAEKSINLLLNNDHIMQLVAHGRAEAVPALFTALYGNTQTHWNTNVLTATYELLKKLIELDSQLFQVAASLYKKKVDVIDGSARTRHGEYAKLERAARSKIRHVVELKEEEEEGDGSGGEGGSGGEEEGEAEENAYLLGLYYLLTTKQSQDGVFRLSGALKDLPVPVNSREDSEKKNGTLKGKKDLSRTSSTANTDYETQNVSGTTTTSNNSSGSDSDGGPPPESAFQPIVVCEPVLSSLKPRVSLEQEAYAKNRVHSPIYSGAYTPPAVRSSNNKPTSSKGKAQTKTPTKIGAKTETTGEGEGEGEKEGEGAAETEPDAGVGEFPTVTESGGGGGGGEEDKNANNKSSSSSADILSTTDSASAFADDRYGRKGKGGSGGDGEGEGEGDEAEESGGGKDDEGGALPRKLHSPVFGPSGEFPPSSSSDPSSSNANANAVSAASPSEVASSLPDSSSASSSSTPNAAGSSSLPNDVKSFSSPSDAGSTPSDAGSAPSDAVSAPSNAGSASSDAVSAPADTGSAPADTGSAPADAGSTPADAGSSQPDAGSSSPPDGGSSPSKAGSSQPDSSTEVVSSSPTEAGLSPSDVPPSSPSDSASSSPPDVGSSSPPDTASASPPTSSPPAVASDSPVYTSAVTAGSGSAEVSSSSSSSSATSSAVDSPAAVSSSSPPIVPTLALPITASSSSSSAASSSLSQSSVSTPPNASKKKKSSVAAPPATTGSAEAAAAAAQKSTTKPLANKPPPVKKEVVGKSKKQK